MVRYTYSGPWLYIYNGPQLYIYIVDHGCIYIYMAKTILKVLCIILLSDEDNWRNDYPDEEESDRSSNSSVDSPNNDYYRHREPYFG